MPLPWLSYIYEGIIQKKSASGSWTLPCLVIFFQNFILIRKCQKWSLNRGTLVSTTAIYQTKCPFTVLSALFSSQSALFISKKTCITLNIKTVSKHFYSPQFYIIGGLIIRELELFKHIMLSFSFCLIGKWWHVSVV